MHFAYKFTGKERDTESGLDYFGARYYASNVGRWMSPDWSATAETIPYANLDNPQSLNLYQYEGNNPLASADKDGHCWPFCDVVASVAMSASVYLANHPYVAKALSEVAESAKIKLSLGVGGGFSKGSAKLSGSAAGFVKFGANGVDSAGAEGRGAATIGGAGVEASSSISGVNDGQFVNPLNNIEGSLSVTGTEKLDKHSAATGSISGDEVSAGLDLEVGGFQGGAEVSSSNEAAKRLTNAVGDGVITDSVNLYQALKQTNGCSNQGCATPSSPTPH